MANQFFAGFIHTDAGVAVNGAIVELFDRNTTSPLRASTTSNSSGYWSISHATEGRFDVRITNGSTIRFIKYDDQVQLNTVEVATLRVRNPADTFDYDIVPAAIVADRQLTLPLLTGTDTLVTLALAQTLTNKTLTSPVLTTPQINDTSADHQYIVAVSELAADRTVTLPQLTGTDTFMFAAFHQANQTAMEAETNQDTYVAPDFVKYSPGVAKAWCVFDGTDSSSITPAASYNVVDVTDVSAGRYTVNISTDFSSANFVAVAASQDGITSDVRSGTTLRAFAAGTIQVQHVLEDVTSGVSAAADCTAMCVVCFGDQ
jgi:hypothetical protein